MSNVFHLRITLKQSDPVIWRRVIVEENISFYQLHHIIQIAMGWKNSHMFEFNVYGRRIALPDEEFDATLDIATQDARSVSLSEAIEKEAGQEILYIYDFGDSWYHDIIVEKVVPKKRGEHFPICTAGEFNCPPEDCGGIPGYYNYLDILKKPRHPEYRETREWIGKDFDPNNFDISTANKQLGSLTAYIKKWERD